MFIVITMCWFDGRKELLSLLRFWQWKIYQEAESLGFRNQFKYSSFLQTWLNVDKHIQIFQN